MKYNIKEKDGRYAIVDDNDEIAGSFRSKDMANQIADNMNKPVKPAKKVKKTKKSNKKEK